MISYDEFYKSFGVKNDAEFRRIHTFKKPGVCPLPKDSILHIFDRIYSIGRDTQTIDFNMDSPFFDKTVFGVFNMSDFNTGIFKRPKNFKILSKDIQKELTNFKAAHQGRFQYISTPDRVVTSSNKPVVVNYNPLLRARCTATRRLELNTVIMVLQQIINNVNKMDKNQFIHIPLSTITYDRHEFNKLFKVNKMINYTHPYSIHYVLEAQILLFFNTLVNGGLFDYIVPEKLKTLTFIFSVNDKHVFYNANAVIKINKQNNKFKNIYDQLSHLSITGRESEVSDDMGELDDIDIKEVVNKVSPIIEKSMKGEYKPKVVKLNSIKEIGIASERAIRKYSKDLTEKQIAKLKELSGDYKYLQIGDTSFEKLLKQDPVKLRKIQIDKLEYLKEHVEDETMLISNIRELRNQYMQNMFERDFAACLTGFAERGYFLTNIKKDEQRDILNKTDHYSVTFTDVNRERHTIKFGFPHVTDTADIISNGNTYQLRFQSINKPIVKISDDTVAISTASKKCIIQRNRSKATSFQNHIINILRSNTEGELDVIYGNNTVDKELKVPYEYSVLAKVITSIEFINNRKEKFHFVYDCRFDDLHEKAVKQYKRIEKKLYGVYIGGTSKQGYFLTDAGEFKKYDTNTFKQVSCAPTLIDYLYTIFGKPTKPIGEWVSVKVFNKKYPVILILASQYGLTNTLKYLDVDYQTFINPERPKITNLSDIVIKFQDRSLVFKRTPITKALFTNGLRWLNSSSFYYEELDEPETYLSIFVGAKHGVDAMFNGFLDFKTKEILAGMGEPTNMRDLLIRATTMLVNEAHIEPASVDNFRSRTFEKFTAVLQGTLGNAINKHQHMSPLHKTKLSIKPFEVYNTIMADTLMDNANIINPIHQLRMDASFSYTGVGGRSDQSFVLKDRRFPKDGTGTISSASADSGKVGMNAGFTQDPSIVDLNGMIQPRDLKDVTPGNMLSVTDLLIPGATQDDMKRANFINIQMSQYVATVESDVCSVRTGYEKVIGSLGRWPFAEVSKQDGVVLKNDKTLKVVKIKYKDGKVKTFQYGTVPTNNGGVYITQNISCDVEEGQKFKRGTTLLHNSDYFSITSDNVLTYKLGANLRIALMECDNTIEDSSGITRSGTAKLRFQPIHRRTIVLHKKCNVFDIAREGADLLNTDNLMVFDEGDIPDIFSTGLDLEELSELSRSMPKANHTGKVVKISCVYNCELKDMSDSLKKTVKKLIRKQDKLAAIADDSNSDFLPAKPLIGQEKLGKAIVSEESVVIDFYIQQLDSLDAGDKVVFGSSMKSINSEVLEYDLLAADIYDEHNKRLQLDGLFSQTSIGNRVVNSPKILGIGQMWTDGMNKKIPAMYYDK
ncbi:MAG: hypothetical protein GY804_09050 [Alphaproteobacteria bacterium]|nr:hypothetical protein [Alphaproteobacteria bacterium]